MKAFLFTLVFLVCSHADAWERRGHALVAAAASSILVKENEILKERSFDLEYYSNVPDLVWKDDDKVYPIEQVEHFMNLEIFERETKSKKIPFTDNRNDFFTKFPKIAAEAGRAFWRVHELTYQLSATTEELRQSDLKNLKLHNVSQARWLIIAGAIAHYVGDLGVPLHLTENHDGQLTDQKGIHHFFEGTMVDELYPEISEELFKRVKNQWPAFHKANQKTEIFDLMIDLGNDSFSKKDKILSIDKSKGRDIKKVKSQYRPIILNQLTQASLYLAEVWSRQLGWKYNSQKFFNFDPKPAYIEPHRMLNQTTEKKSE